MSDQDGLEAIFKSCDVDGKGYLTMNETPALLETIGRLHKWPEELAPLISKKLSDSGIITLGDIRFMQSYVQTFHPEEQVMSPSTTIIHILKQLRAMGEVSEEDKKTIDWGINAILTGRVYQTELGSSDKDLVNKANNTDNMDFSPIARKLRLVPWMENFSTPKIDSEINKVHSAAPRKDRLTTFSDSTGPTGRLGEQLSLLLERVKPQLDLEKTICSPNFNVFEHERVLGRKNLLPAIAYYVFKKDNLFTYIDEAAFENFIEKIRDGYRSTNPYHSDIHAADVVQMCHYMITCGGVREVAKLDGLDVAAIMIAAIVHDYKHPGVNNGYLQNTMNDLALLYNDQSILENYHVSEAFRVIWKDEECNIFKKLTPEEKKLIRKRMTGCILYTDNAKHFELVNMLESLIAAMEISKGKNSEKIINTATAVTEFESKQKILTVCLHASDISNSMRPFNISSEWARRVTDEFYHQGDREKAKKMPVSPFCDRLLGNLPSSQVGFISGIVRPYAERLVQIFPRLQPLLDNLNAGEKEWAKMIAAAKPHQDMPTLAATVAKFGEAAEKKKAPEPAFEAEAEVEENKTPPSPPAIKEPAGEDGRDQEMARLKAENETLSGKGLDLGVLRARVEEAEHRFRTAEAEKERLRIEEEKEKSHAILDPEVAKTKERAERLEQDLVKKRAELAGLKDKARERMEEVSQLRMAASRSQNQEILRLRRRAATLKSELESTGAARRLSPKRPPTVAALISSRPGPARSVKGEAPSQVANRRLAAQKSDLTHKVDYMKKQIHLYDVKTEAVSVLIQAKEAHSASPSPKKPPTSSLSEITALRNKNEIMRILLEKYKNEAELEKLHRAEQSVRNYELVRAKDRLSADVLLKKAEARSALRELRRMDTAKLLEEQDQAATELDAIRQHARLLEGQNSGLHRELDKFVETNEKVRGELDWREEVERMKGKNQRELQRSAEKLKRISPAKSMFRIRSPSLY